VRCRLHNPGLTNDFILKHFGKQTLGQHFHGTTNLQTLTYIGSFHPSTYKCQNQSPYLALIPSFFSLLDNAPRTQPDGTFSTHRGPTATSDIHTVANSATDHGTTRLPSRHAPLSRTSLPPCPTVVLHILPRHIPSASTLDNRQPNRHRNTESRTRTGPPTARRPRAIYRLRTKNPMGKRNGG
jgi:hypothetical protein